MEANPRTPDLSVANVFGRGWAGFKRRPGLALGAFVAYSLLTSLGSFFREGSALGSLVQVAGLVIHAPLLAGLYFVALRLLRGQPAQFDMMFQGFTAFARTLGVFWLMAALIVGGMILLVVPGVIVALGLTPAMFVVLEGDLGVIGTLSRAWEMTRGHKGSIFVVSLAVVGFNILGLLALGIGILFTGAVSILVLAAVYEELKTASEALGQEAVAG